MSTTGTTPLNPLCPFIPATLLGTLTHAEPAPAWRIWGEPTPEDTLKERVSEAVTAGKVRFRANRATRRALAKRERRAR